MSTHGTTPPSTTNTTVGVGTQEDAKDKHNIAVRDKGGSDMAAVGAADGVSAWDGDRKESGTGSGGGGGRGVERARQDARVAREDTEAADETLRSLRIQVDGLAAGWTERRMHLLGETETEQTDRTDRHLYSSMPKQIHAFVGRRTKYGSFLGPRTCTRNYFRYILNSMTVECLPAKHSVNSNTKHKKRTQRKYR